MKVAGKNINRLLKDGHTVSEILLVRPKTKERLVFSDRCITGIN